MSNYILKQKCVGEREYYFFYDTDSGVPRPDKWTGDLILDLMSIVHQYSGVSDVYLVSGEPISLKGSKGNLLVCLSDRPVLSVTTSDALKDYFRLVGVDGFSVTTSREPLSIRVNVAKPGSKLKSTFRTEICNFSNSNESSSIFSASRPTSVPPDLCHLNIHPLAKSISDIHSGLIVFIGSTGTGKSTSMFSILGDRGRNTYQTIVTVENPIEYELSMVSGLKARVFQFDKSDFRGGFKGAIKTILRSNPDVVMIGEMRDLETIDAALTICRSDHQLFSTAHVDRPWNLATRMFETIQTGGSGNDVMMTDFLEHLRGIVAQKLIPTIAGGYFCISDVMFFEAEDKRLILEVFRSTLRGLSFSHEGRVIESVAAAFKILLKTKEKQGVAVSMESMLAKALHDGVISKQVYEFEFDKLN